MRVAAGTDVNQRFRVAPRKNRRRSERNSQSGFARLASAGAAGVCLLMGFAYGSAFFQPGPSVPAQPEQTVLNLPGRTVALPVDTQAVHLSQFRPDAPAQPSRPPVPTQAEGAVLSDAVAVDGPDTAVEVRPGAGEGGFHFTLYQGLTNHKVVLPVAEAPAAVHAWPPPAAGPSTPSVDLRQVAVAPTAPAAPAREGAGIAPSAAAYPEKGQGVEPSAYMIQVSVHPRFEDAARLASSLQRQGAPAHVIPIRTGSEQAIFRVRLGPFPSRHAADIAMGRWQLKTGRLVAMDPA